MTTPADKHGLDPFGAHRVIEPRGALPQAAWRIDNDLAIARPLEMLIDVETLNIDAASFRQMEEAAKGDLAGVERAILDTISQRGKQHNPVTGSGGMLLGRVAEIGPGFDAKVAVGDRIATLVSLSLTPLRVDRIKSIRRESAQVDVEGRAALFASGPFAIMPTDMPERLALAVLDVCGAPPQIARTVHRGESVLILGAGGKSGVLCAMEARRRAGPSGRVIGVENIRKAAEELRSLAFCDKVVEADARDPIAVRSVALAANEGREFDRAVSCVNVQDAEMSAILCTRDRGSIFFFATSTSFTKAALGAEGVGKDVDMLIGNGYAAGHAEHSLSMLRESPALRALFARRYAS